jgi:hypothetical protein
MALKRQEYVRGMFEGVWLGDYWTLVCGATQGVRGRLAKSHNHDVEVIGYARV